MVEIIRTLSNGEIYAGYVYGKMSFIEFGGHNFNASDFCVLMRYFASHSNAFDGSLMDYSVKKSNDAKLVSRVKKSVEVLGWKIWFDGIRDFVDKNEKRFVSLDDQLNGVLVPFNISKDGVSIAVGQYGVESREFCNFVSYVAQGGSAGICRMGYRPSFADVTLDAMLNSKHVLFKGWKKFNK